MSDVHFFLICRNYYHPYQRHGTFWSQKNKFDSNILESNFTFLWAKIILIHISALSIEQIYRLLMKIKNESICIKYWQDKFGISYLQYWNKIFTFKIKNRIENKFGHFQYNLLLNLIPCKKILYKWKISDSDECCFCNCLKDYNHFFFFTVCEKKLRFWKSFKKCLYVLIRIHFNLPLENIIYGWNIDKINCAFVNFLFIVASFFGFQSPNTF